MTGSRDDYRTDDPNKTLPLYSGPITLRHGEDHTTADGTIELCWLPKLRIRFGIPEFPRAPFMSRLGGWAGSEPHLTIPGANEGCSTIISQANMSLQGPASLAGILNAGLQIGDGSELQSVVYRVANLGHFLLKGPIQDRMIWETDEWRVTIRPLDHVQELLKQLKDVGGYAITHEAHLEKADGTTFTSEDARNVDIGLYLSFIQGRRANTILPVGYDSEKRPVWREWAPWRVDPWQSVFSWADPHHGNDLAGAFPGFMRLWADESWRRTLRLAIGWYGDANRNESGLEAGIVFAQMALELLAWKSLVEQTAAMTREGFKNLTAVDRIRLLMSIHQIPLAIPPAFSEMSCWAGEFNWTDVADGITRIRNNIVHPDTKLRARVFDSSGPLLAETWLCGLWLLELILLRLFEYNGPYQDRRKTDKYVSDVSRVPWAE